MLVSTLYPFPADVGKKVVITGLIRFFCEKVSAQNFYLVYPDKDTERELPHEFNRIQYPFPAAAVRLKNILFQTFLLRRNSIQESLFSSDAVLTSVQQAINTVKPDLIVFDTIRMGQYFPKLDTGSARSVLYLDDLFSVRYKSMIRALNSPKTLAFNPLGNFERHVPAVFRPLIKKFAFLQKLLLSYESKLVESSEIKQAKYFPSNLLINKTEVELLRSRGGNNVNVCPPYVSSAIRPYARSWQGAPVFVFLGGLDVPHNAVSLECFIDEQLPQIIEVIPDVIIRVIGKNPAASLLALARKFPDNLKIEGYVESLDEVLHGACAMLVPLLFGSGVKLKTIDALSYGLPIIATDFGIEGVGVSDNNEHCIVENDLSKYAMWMKNLLDASFNNRIALSSYEFYLENYSSGSVGKKYSEIFGMQSLK